MKVCDGEERKWPTAMHAVFWAEQITTHKALGHSVYYIAHGVEPLLPFDLAEATYMVPPQSAMSTTELIVQCSEPDDDPNTKQTLEYIQSMCNAR
jgi:hypothetical protein